MIFYYLNKTHGVFVYVVNIGYPRPADVIDFSNSYNVDWVESSNSADVVEFSSSSAGVVELGA